MNKSQLLATTEKNSTEKKEGKGKFWFSAVVRPRIQKPCFSRDYPLKQTGAVTSPALTLLEILHPSSVNGFDLLQLGTLHGRSLTTARDTLYRCDAVQAIFLL